MSLTRTIRRQQSRHKQPRRLPRPGQMIIDQTKIWLSVQFKEAMLNWQSVPANIEKMYEIVEAARRKLQPELADNNFKSIMRDRIIDSLKTNKHLDKKEGEHIASVCMWYMWLKRDEAKFD